MKIIVGLGNPGKKYENTRHNVGFLALGKVREKLKDQSEKQEEFRLENKFDAEVAKFKLGSEDVLLAKPQTFMNNSGLAVRKIVDFYKDNSKEDLIIVHDDMDIELGKISIKASGSSAGHKGVQSIIDTLSTEDFLRVRIGVGRPFEGRKPEDYVLENFNDSEKAVLDKTIEDFVEKAQIYLK